MQIWVLIQWLTRWVSEWPIPRKHLSSLFSTRCPIFLKAAAPAPHNSRNRSSTNAGTSSTCLRRLPHGPPACRWSPWRRRWTRRPSGSSRPTCTSHRREEAAVAEPQAERGRDDRSAAADYWIQVPKNKSLSLFNLTPHFPGNRRLFFWGLPTSSSISCRFSLSSKFSVVGSITKKGNLSPAADAGEESDRKSNEALTSYLSRDIERSKRGWAATKDFFSLQL